MLNDQYVIILKQFRASTTLFQSIRKLSFKVIYIGLESEMGELADEWINCGIDSNIEDILIQIGDKSIIEVITLSEDALLFQNILREKLGLNYIPNEIVKEFRDKLLMNKKLAQMGIAVAKQQDYNENFDIDKMTFPLFVKPATGYASAGAQKVDNPEDFKKAIKTIKRINQFALKKEMPKNIGIVVEEYIDGKEYSIDSLSIEGKTRIFCICEREFPSKDSFQDYIYRSCHSEVENEITENLTQQLEKLFSSFNYTGASHTEVRYCSSRKKWFVIESALRVGFAGVMGDYFKFLTGVNYNDLLVKTLLHKIDFQTLKEIKLDRTQEGLLMILPMYEGGEISEIEEVNSHVLCEDIFINVKKGQRIIPYPKGIEYMGHLICLGVSLQDVDRKIKKLESTRFFKYKRF